MESKKRLWGPMPKIALLRHVAQVRLIILRDLCADCRVVTLWHVAHALS